MDLVSILKTLIFKLTDSHDRSVNLKGKGLSLTLLVSSNN
jgi:hypothetical protein